MPQFLVDSKNIFKDNISLSISESHHLLRVLRKTTGDEITVSDGEGKQYSCILVNTDSEIPKATLKILQIHIEESLKPKIHLACALLKNQRMDWLIEKATELGVDEITPLLSQHCVVELKTEKDKAKKQERLISLAQAALKQSQNLNLPLINKISNFQEYIQQIDKQNLKTLKALFHPYESLELVEMETKILSKSFDECLILTGPEGGFSEVEIRMAKNQGFENYSLGRNILRGETAGIYALSVLNYWRGKRNTSPQPSPTLGEGVVGKDLV